MLLSDDEEPKGSSLQSYHDQPVLHRPLEWGMPLVAESRISKSQRCMYVALQLKEGQKVHGLKSR